jgi:hypothetical protein
MRSYKPLVIFVFLAWLGLILLSRNCEAKPKLEPSYQIQTTPVGAIFRVKNPLKTKIQVRFVCEDAYLLNWITLPKKSNKKIEVVTRDPFGEVGEPIVGPCRMDWRKA